MTAEKLHRLGIHTVGELAELEAATAERLLGKATGAHLHALARLRDPRPVDTTRRRGSIGSQRALGSRPRTPDELDLILTQIVDRLGPPPARRRPGLPHRRAAPALRRLREGHPVAHRRRRRPTAPRCCSPSPAALLAAAQPEIAERGITLIGISLSQLGRADSIQPELPIDWDEGERLDTVLDAVRDKFGAASVARAAQLGRDEGLSAPLLPEHM